MTEVISVLIVLAGLAFLLQIALDRVKDIIPVLGGTYSFSIKSVTFSISPMQFISLACGIGLMFAINQPISLFGALGYEVPDWINHVVNGVLVSGGSGYCYDIIHQLRDKKESQESSTTAE